MQNIQLCELVSRLLWHSCQGIVVKDDWTELFQLISSLIRTPISGRAGVYDSPGEGHISATWHI